MTRQVAMLFAATLATTTPYAAGQDDGRLTAAILHGLRAIEAAMRVVSVAVSIDVVELDGVAVDPPARSRARWACRGGRVLVEVAGCDLDVGTPGLERSAARRRLYFPGGTVESLDEAGGGFTRERRSFTDPSMLGSDLGPAEFAWSFCGSARSSIFGARVIRIAAVAGQPPKRRVAIVADDSEGAQRIELECREDWGWLATRATMSVRDGAEWRVLRQIDVTSVRPTRLGFFPKEATLWALRPPGGATGDLAAFRPMRARHAFDEPSFGGVVVPRSLAGDAPESRVAASRRKPRSEGAGLDPILSSASVLFREPIAARADDLARFLAPVLPVRAHGDPQGRRARRWPVVAALLAAIAVGCAAFATRRTGLLTLSAVACLAGAAGVGAAAVARSVEHGGDVRRIEGVQRIPSPLPPASRTLCGVDALAIALALGGRAPDTERLVRLVRPGAHGTTVAALLTAAECLGLEPRLVDPGAFDAPPDPLVAHLPPAHFVVVTAAARGGVIVVDPSRGAFLASWDRVRAALSPIAIALPGAS